VDNQAAGRARVLILGYGEMGHAMEFLLGPRASLDIWQRRAPAEALEAAAARAEFVLFCVPGHAHAELAARLAARLAPTGLCLTVAKGLAPDGRTPAEVLAEIFGRERTVVLYGPMIAEEICTGRPAFGECGSADAAAAARAAALFAGSTLRLETARDVVGLSWSAMLKNVYAIAFGMADELALGDNVRGVLAAGALQELAALTRHFGGEPDTPHRWAGLGDLITTATSAGSHHHELGRLVVRGEPGLGGEGINTLNALHARPRFAVERFPLFELIAASVREPASATARLQAYLRHGAPRAG